MTRTTAGIAAGLVLSLAPPIAAPRNREPSALGQEYYFAIEAFDEVGVSRPSAVVRVE